MSGDVETAAGKLTARQRAAVVAGHGSLAVCRALKAKGISDYCIRKGLASIDAGDYERVMEKLFLAKKKNLSSEKNLFTKKAKIRQHLLQKGFEADLVDELIRKI